MIAKKLALWGAIAFLVYFAATQPGTARSVIVSVGRGLASIVSSLLNLIKQLF